MLKKKLRLRHDTRWEFSRLEKGDSVFLIKRDPWITTIRKLNIIEMFFSGIESDVIIVNDIKEQNTIFEKFTEFSPFVFHGEEYTFLSCFGMLSEYIENMIREYTAISKELILDREVYLDHLRLQEEGRAVDAR